MTKLTKFTGWRQGEGLSHRGAKPQRKILISKSTIRYLQDVTPPVAAVCDCRLPVDSPNSIPPHSHSESLSEDLPFLQALCVRCG